MAAAREEIFGPVVVVVPFDDEAEAVAMANDSPYGLGSSIWTADVARAHRVAGALLTGIVWVNDHHRLDPALPWGGVRERCGPGRGLGVVPRLHPRQVRDRAHGGRARRLVRRHRRPAQLMADAVEGLRSSLAGGVLEVVIDRGGDNIFSLAMCEHLGALLARPPEGAHVLRLRAEGPAFCLGRERRARPWPTSGWRRRPSSG